jgi:hypothetical protein
MRLTDAGLLGEVAYRTVSRFIGQYWFEKGRGSMIDFLNFCTDTQFGITSLWTQDYVYFLDEGDPGIGTTIFDGGTWYPTTHVRLKVIGALAQTDLQSIGAFFYEVANYNLVLDAISKAYSLDIVNCTDTLPPVPNNNLAVVAIGLMSRCVFDIKGSQLPSP